QREHAPERVRGDTRQRAQPEVAVVPGCGTGGRRRGARVEGGGCGHGAPTLPGAPRPATSAFRGRRAARGGRAGPAARTVGADAQAGPAPGSIGPMTAVAGGGSRVAPRSPRRVSATCV